jgi:hypothetical protein
MARALVAGLGVVAVIAVARIDVRRSDMNTSARAIGVLRAISSAQATYAAMNGGYARSLSALSAPCRGVSTGFISPDLAKDPTVTGGYEVRLQATRAVPNRRDCNGQPVSSAYYATAVPVQRDHATTVAFAVDQTQVIWSDDTGVAPTPPFRETSTVRPLR